MAPHGAQHGGCARVQGWWAAGGCRGCWAQWAGACPPSAGSLAATACTRGAAPCQRASLSTCARAHPRLRARAGKSTVLRTICATALLANCGLLVPAAAAEARTRAARRACTSTSPCARPLEAPHAPSHVLYARATLTRAHTQPFITSRPLPCPYPPRYPTSPTTRCATSRVTRPLRACHHGASRCAR